MPSSRIASATPRGVQPRGVDEAIEAAHQTRAHRAAIVGSRRIRDDLEARAGRGARTGPRQETPSHACGSRPTGSRCAGARRTAAARRGGGSAASAPRSTRRRIAAARARVDGCDSSTNGESSGVPVGDAVAKPLAQSRRGRASRRRAGAGTGAATTRRRDRARGAPRCSYACAAAAGSPSLLEQLGELEAQRRVRRACARAPTRASPCAAAMLRRSQLELRLVSRRRRARAGASAAARVAASSASSSAPLRLQRERQVVPAPRVRRVGGDRAARATLRRRRARPSASRQRREVGPDLGRLRRAPRRLLQRVDRGLAASDGVQRQREIRPCIGDVGSMPSDARIRSAASACLPAW